MSLIIRVNKFLMCILLLCSGTAYAGRHYVKREVMLPMRDGVKLYTAIYVPKMLIGKQDKKAPIIMMRTPYGCKPYGEEMSPQLDKDYWKEYLNMGYIIVFQDVRGRYQSEGHFVHLNPQESEDAYDAVEWLVRNVTECNGRVGVTGCSYCGFYAFMAGVNAHPAVRIVLPQAPVTDWWMGDDMHHNGAFCPTGGDFLDYMQYGESEESQEENQDQTADGKQQITQYEEYLNYGTIKNLTAHLNKQRQNDFWNEMVSHQDYDDWWRERDARRYVPQLSVSAVLVTGGTFDGEDYFGTIALYEAIEQRKDIDCHIAIGPWTHGGWRQYENKLGDWRFAWFTSPAKQYMREIELPIVDKYLRDKISDREVAKETYYITGSNRWSTDSLCTPSLQLYMHEGGALSVMHPQSGSSHYVSDPANPVPSNEAMNDGKDYMYADQSFLKGRTDVLSFETAVMPDDMTLRGKAIVHLSVRMTTTDADFFVKIIDVTPDGKQLMVRSEMMRGKYRHVVPEPMSTTEINEFDINLLPFNHTFKRGHKLMVQVQSSAFPLFDRNTQQMVDIYKCEPTDFVSSEIRLMHDSVHACYVLLPIER